MEIEQEQLPPAELETDEPRLLQIPAIEQAEDPPILLNAAGRVARKRRPTWKVLERLPAPPTPVPDRSEAIPPSNSAPDTTAANVASATTSSWCAVHTIQNTFGMYREFSTYPTHNPDDTLTVGDLAQSQPPAFYC